MQFFIHIFKEERINNVHHPKCQCFYFDGRKQGIGVRKEHSYSEMIEKIDEEKNEAEQGQKCIGFHTCLALLIDFFQFLKGDSIHLDLKASKFLREKLSTDSACPGSKSG